MQYERNAQWFSFAECERCTTRGLGYRSTRSTEAVSRKQKTTRRTKMKEIILTCINYTRRTQGLPTAGAWVLGLAVRFCLHQLANITWFCGSDIVASHCHYRMLHVNNNFYYYDYIPVVKYEHFCLFFLKTKKTFANICNFSCQICIYIKNIFFLLIKYNSTD